MCKIIFIYLTICLSITTKSFGQNEKTIFKSQVERIQIPAGYHNATYFTYWLVLDSLHKLNKDKNSCFNELENNVGALTPLMFSLPITDTFFSTINDTIEKIVFISARYFSYNNYNQYSISYLLKSGGVLTYLLKFDDLYFNSYSYEIQKVFYPNKGEAKNFILEMEEESNLAQQNKCASTDFLWQVVAFDFNNIDNYFKAYYLVDKQTDKLSKYFSH